MNKNIDEIFKSNLKSVEVVPSEGVKAGLVKQVSAIILKKVAIYAAVISAGTASVGISGALLLENYYGEIKSFQSEIENSPNTAELWVDAQNLTFEKTQLNSTPAKLEVNAISSFTSGKLHALTEVKKDLESFSDVKTTRDELSDNLHIQNVNQEKKNGKRLAPYIYASQASEASLQEDYFLRKNSPENKEIALKIELGTSSESAINSNVALELTESLNEPEESLLTTKFQTKNVQSVIQLHRNGIPQFVKMDEFLGIENLDLTANENLELSRLRNKSALLTALNDDGQILYNQKIQPERKYSNWRIGIEYGYANLTSTGSQFNNLNDKSGVYYNDAVSQKAAVKLERQLGRFKLGTGLGFSSIIKTFGHRNLEITTLETSELVDIYETVIIDGVSTNLVVGQEEIITQTENEKLIENSHSSQMNYVHVPLTIDYGLLYASRFNISLQAGVGIHKLTSASGESLDIMTKSPISLDEKSTVISSSFLDYKVGLTVRKTISNRLSVYLSPGLLAIGNDLTSMDKQKGISFSGMEVNGGIQIKL